MACEFICDGCGKRMEAEHFDGNWYKPYLWFERSDKDGIQSACSRECIKKISEKSGKTSLIFPV